MSPKKAIAKTTAKAKAKPVKKAPSPKKTTTGKKTTRPAKQASRAAAKPAAKATKKAAKPATAAKTKATKVAAVKKMAAGQKTKTATAKAPKKPTPQTRKPATKRPVTSTPPKTAAKESSAPKAKATRTEAPPSPAVKKPKPAKVKTTVDEMALDIDEKEELLEQEKKDLIKVLREDDDEPLETAFVPTDTSERYILVVDEEGQRRTETMTIISQILPNAVIEVADDPEEALDVMQEGDFDTFVVNFLMPGYSASPFVKAVANHPDHPLLIGFAADKISDALDQRKGLKIIPLKRLFDLEPSPDGNREKA